MEETKKSNDMPEAVPYIVFEGTMVRNERTVKRLIVGLVISVILIFASNAAWLYAWTLYDYSSDTITVDSEDGGNANFIGKDGDIHNGEDSSPKAIKTEKRNESPKDKDSK